MIDLTPLDVRKKRGDFGTKLRRGYDPEEVDGFLELVAERFEELVKENLTLTDQVERLGNQLEALEGRESAVHEALVSAQKLREEVSDQTQREAESLKEQSRREAVILKAEAETEVSRRLGEAERLLRERQWALEELEKSRGKFLKGFRNLLERELEALEVEEARRPLEETPLDLNLRGWTSAREEEDLPGAIMEEAEDHGPSGFETQRLEVSVASEPPEEPEPEIDPGEFLDRVADEMEGTEGVDGAVEEAGSDNLTDETLGEMESAQSSGDLSEDPSHEPEHRHQAEPAQVSMESRSQDLEPEVGVEEGEPSPVPQEPKWLFSLLKREDGDVPEGEAEGGSSEREV